MARICLITPHHVSFQPRTVREADSLHEAGHDVRVVCLQTDPMLTEHDRRLMRTRTWRLQPVDLRRNGPHRKDWFSDSIRLRAAKWLFHAGMRTINLATRGYVKGFDRLTALAASEPTDWFIAHTQAGLPVVATVTKRLNARMGLDCEDLLTEAGSDPSDIVRLIERAYLPQCEYVSTPSLCIANQLVKDYGISAPLVLYNVFPTHLASGLLPPDERPVNSVTRLHWFGQTLGPGRGIEEAVEALALLGPNVELHLRGRLSNAYRVRIETLAQGYGVTRKIVILPPVDHDQLISAIGQFDVGLALERSEHSNYSQTVTNKVFTYLLAGLAIAATDTPGQREILGEVPSVGFTYPSGDSQALARGLRRLMSDPEDLLAAKQAAWRIARQRFCWDVQKEKLLSVINDASGEPPVHAHSSCR